MSVKFALKSLWGLEQEFGSVIKGLIQKQKERKGLLLKQFLVSRRAWANCVMP